MRNLKDIAFEIIFYVTLTLAILLVHTEIFLSSRKYRLYEIY